MASVQYGTGNTAWTTWNTDTLSRRMWDVGTSASSTAIVWQNWCEALGQLTVAVAQVASSLDQVWYVWNTSTNGYTSVVHSGTRRTHVGSQTREEAEAARAERLAQERDVQRRFEERRQERLAREAERERNMEMISAAAKAILMENLNAAQLAQYQAHGHFDVLTALGKRYRIVPGERVRLMDGPEGDYELARYCIHPVEWYPDEDVMLMQKLMLDTDEAQLIKIANRSDAPGDRRRPRVTVAPGAGGTRTAPIPAEALREAPANPRRPRGQPPAPLILGGDVVDADRFSPVVADEPVENVHEAAFAEVSGPAHEFAPGFHTHLPPVELIGAEASQRIALAA